MPEILEVEAYRIAAEPVVGRTIVGVHAPDAWYLKGGIDAEGLTAAVEGHRITGTRRIGKLLLLDTEGPAIGLRFGMTGRLVVDGAAPIETLQYSSDRDLPEWHRFGLELAPTGGLIVADPRRLGGVELDPDEDRLGVDAFDLDAAALGAVVAGSGASVKARLMDQSRVAGLGNLLVDEILWRSGVDPSRPARSVGSDEVTRVARSVAEVLAELGARGGSHTGDLGPERAPGGVCPRDGAPLQRRTVGGRTTWSCPLHQL